MIDPTEAHFTATMAVDDDRPMIRVASVGLPVPGRIGAEDDVDAIRTDPALDRSLHG